MTDVNPAKLNDDPFLSAKQAAAYLGLDGVVKHGGHCVRGLCRRGKLPSVRIAGKVFVRLSDLNRYIAQNTKPATV